MTGDLVLFFLKTALFLLAKLPTTTTLDNTLPYTNTWAVHIPKGDHERANIIAERHGMVNLGQIGNLDGYYHFEHKGHPRRMSREVTEHTERLSVDSEVSWVEQQIVKKRVKRDTSAMKFTDPFWQRQWYLYNTRSGYDNYDHNVIPVWHELNITGRGVSVSILDDGILKTHPDLKDNYDPAASFDYNDNDNDPTPRPTMNNENRHGTRCAGEVAAAANNNKCIVGVAYGAKIGGIRMLDGDVTDVVESKSLSYNHDHIDIYSSSWGPDDDGRTVDGPGRLAKAAFLNGIKKGRGGLGNIFVWASGNGGRDHDNCNCDGYTNSIYTLSISSATELGTQPWYSEFCASTLATTFSSGHVGERQIATTDLHNSCTSRHTGTSASAPLAAGIFALALEANPKLTWRDLQHIVVRTSKSDKLATEDWVVNGVGRKVSHKFGYGLLDAKDLVETAMRWPTIGAQHTCFETAYTKASTISGSGSVKLIKNSKGCSGTPQHVRYLEHVEAIISLKCSIRGDLTIYLTSPQGTRATLLKKRPYDTSSAGFNKWVFMSTHTWEEDPSGDWKLEIESDGRMTNTGAITFWQLRFYGTETKPGYGGKNCAKQCKNGCNGPTAKDCYQCSKYKHNGVCVDSCPVNTYVGASKICLACQSTCNGCFGPNSDQCKNCTAPKFLLNGTCVDKCPNKWFANQINRSCDMCHNRCLSCTGQSTYCTACKPDHKLINNNCIITCKSTEFVKNDQCRACHPSCAACKNGTAWSCTACGTITTRRENFPQDLYLHRGMCVVSCPSGFYGDKHACHPCDASCKHCSGPAKTQCTSCKHGLVKMVKAVNGSTLCLDNCPKGYSRGISDTSCIKCGSGCTACDPDHPGNCTACKSGLVSWKRKCISPELCPQGTYNSSNEKCEYCHPACLSCVGNATTCSLCAQHFHLHGNQCVAQCPVETTSRNASCVSCSDNCSDCFGINSDQCLSCKNGFYLLENSCVEKCPNGTFVNQVNGVCSACSITCDRCVGVSTNCSKCKDGLKMDSGVCKPVCNTSTKHCCHQSCFICNGPSKTDCLRCKGVKFYNPLTKLCSLECPLDGYYEDIPSTLCKKCPATCSQCHNEHACAKCKPGLFLYGKKCTQYCPKGFYSHTDSCGKCAANCHECSGTADTCTSCGAGLILHDYKCVSECPRGMYLSKVLARCLPCDMTCGSCAGPGHAHCTSCQQPLVLFQAQCRSSCPAKFYINPKDKQCQPCDYYCERCDGGNGLTNCSKCIAPFVLQKSMCVRSCSRGFVLDESSQTCLRCHKSCSTCLGTSKRDCLSCSDPNASLEGSMCTKSCPNGKYKDKVTLHCEECHPNCKTCNGSEATSCTSCHIGKPSPKKECSSGCAHNQYLQHGQCYMCSTPCKTCKGPSNDDCLSCYGKRMLHNFTCVKRCAPGTYRKVFKDGVTECRNCHASCATCSANGRDKCLSCRLDLYKERTKCVKQCSINYQLDEDTRVCIPCHANCPKYANVTDRSVHVINDAPDTKIAGVHKRSFVLTAFIAGFIVLTAIGVFMYYRGRSNAGYTRVTDRRTREMPNNNIPDVYVQNNTVERQPMLDLEENEL